MGGEVDRPAIEALDLSPLWLADAAEDGPWQEIPAGLHAFRLVVPFALGVGDPSNVYLFNRDNQWLMVDAGADHEPSGAVLKRFFAEHGVTGRNLTVFFTHMHEDHSWLVDCVPEGSVAYVHRHGVESREPGRQQEIQEEFREMLEAGGVPHDQALVYQEDNRERTRLPEGRLCVRPLEGGERLQLLGMTWQVIFSPGHSPNHLLLLQPETGLLFSGDVVLADRTPSVELTEFGTSGMGQYLQTLDDLERLRVRMVLPGHGDSASKSQVNEWIARIRSRKLARVEAVRCTMREHPGLDLYHGAWMRLGCQDEAQWLGKPHFQRYFALLETAVVMGYVGETEAGA